MQLDVDSLRLAAASRLAVAPRYIGFDLRVIESHQPVEACKSAATAFGKAIAGVANDPCYLNEENALEVAFGADWAAAAGPEIRAFLAGLGADKAAACFSPPPEEYAFPRDLFRY